MAIKKSRPIRDPAFGERFRRACENSPHVPAKHEGRYVYVRAKYNEQAEDTITIETVRKWHEGETAPRAAKIAMLADILGCSPNWLQTGFGEQYAQSRAERLSDYQPSVDSVNKISNAIVPVPLRPGVTVEIRGLPSDLTDGEAKRIANIVLAYGVGK